MRILCDHQTGYLPWLGLFHRISLCDIYISLDTVKYQPSSFDDRNKIKTPEGFKWLKVPTKKSGSGLLKDVKVNHEVFWIKDHLKSIESSYGGTPYFQKYFLLLTQILNKKHEYLMDLNEELLQLFLQELNISVEFHKASSKEVEGKNNLYLINLCKAFQADTYVFGNFGKEYADAELWKKHEITIYFQSYQHPEYSQKFKNFEPYLSILDALFLHGPKKTKEIIMQENITKEQLKKLLRGTK